MDLRTLPIAVALLAAAAPAVVQAAAVQAPMGSLGSLALTVTTDRTQLDVSSLGNGVYLLNARNGEASRSARVIVQH